MGESTVLKTKTINFRPQKQQKYAKTIQMQDSKLIPHTLKTKFSYFHLSFFLAQKN
jgi:hypothetical protein